MKSFLTSLWQRRWCRLLGIAMILCALPLLHPFVRQTIFGPTIEGVPWCVWEDEIRYAADPPPARRDWFHQQLATIGYYDTMRLPMERNSAALAVYLQLAEDRDLKVRRFALRQLLEWVNKDWVNQDDPSLLVLRRRLEDEDLRCREWAAAAVWRLTKDRDVIAIVTPLADHADLEVKRSAVYLLQEIASVDATVFDVLAERTRDPDRFVRDSAVCSMRHFGKRGVPILRESFRDADKTIRLSAIYAASQLRGDGAALIPALLAQQNDPNANIRRSASQALHLMDPKGFAEPAAGGD